MLFGMGFQLGLAKRVGGCTNSHVVSCTAILAMCGTLFSRRWFRDRPDMTGTTPYGRADSPSLMGQPRDRIGK